MPPGIFTGAPFLFPAKGKSMCRLHGVGENLQSESLPGDAAQKLCCLGDGETGGIQ